ncbi:DMT family transporter [Clostridium tyrobutyricum]|uniref:DMT family transporter n=1 Tax=Clostridium tyrobutyricum TaxID=1519 RepID=UPI0002F71CBF|nr:DMT family transporter [Clostridium tyrobutyricum]MEA5009621.1 DMT family transporter [Clostridium tyrobutyricum]
MWSDLRRGYIYSILASIMFGSAGIFVKLSYNIGLDSINILVAQYIIAVIIMFLFIFISDRKKLLLNRTQIFHLAVLGICGNTFMTLFYYEAFKYLSVAMVTMLLFTYPIMVFIYSVLRKNEKVTLRKFIAILISFAGCIMGLNIFGENLNYSIRGVIFGLLSAVFYAFMNLYSEKKFKDVDSMSMNAYSTLFSLIVLLIYRSPHFLSGGNLNIHSTLYILMLAVFSEIIPLTLLYSSIKYIGAVKTSIIGNLEIPASIVFSTLLLGENINIVQIVGAVFIVYAIYIIRGRTYAH